MYKIKCTTFRPNNVLCKISLIQIYYYVVHKSKVINYKLILFYNYIFYYCMEMYVKSVLRVRMKIYIYIYSTIYLVYSNIISM